jgi:hypothetical protein
MAVPVLTPEPALARAAERRAEGRARVARGKRFVAGRRTTISGGGVGRASGQGARAKAPERQLEPRVVFRAGRNPH